MGLLFTVLRALAYSAGFVALWGWLALAVRPLDRTLGVALPGWTVVGVGLIALGGALALSCVLVFAVRGAGTPAPFDPPRRFVAAGPYRYVRNPMYLAGFTALMGFGLYHHSPAILALAGVMLGLAHLFVLLYEEPNLERRFGESYREYKRTVRRWLPSRPEEGTGSLARAVTVRAATAGDAGVLARHRAEMFRDMGTLAPEAYDTLVQASRRYFETAIPAGTYVGWVAAPAERPDEIVAGAGVQVRELLPRPDASGRRLVGGPEGYVLNVFTERAWRRRGIAERLMREVLAWARAHRIEHLTLHASDAGWALYERLGFVRTNEMRYKRGSPLAP